MAVLGGARLLQRKEMAANSGAAGYDYLEEAGAGYRAVRAEEAVWTSDAWKNIFAQSGQYPEALLRGLERNPELLEFAQGYLTAERTAAGGLTGRELEEDCPLLIQWDKRWGYVPYGRNVIGISGCGPTCLSMVLCGLTKNAELTPDVMAELAMEEGYYVSGEGTAWSYLTEVAPRYGVMALQYDSWPEEMIRQYLEDGKLLILSMGPGDFTDEGHFIVVRGYEDGKLLVNDPFSYANSEKKWEYDTVAEQCKQMWAYEALAE